MALAFTENEREEIESNLIQIAQDTLKTTSWKKIKVEDLARSANISKGAFYHFYSSKEELFYEVMCKTHDEIYGKAMKCLYKKNMTPNEKITQAIMQSIEALQASGLWDFWANDASSILSKIDSSRLIEQKKRQEKVFRLFFETCGTLKVSEELAIHALQSLIQTSSFYLMYTKDYKKILKMMADGVCESIFD